MSKLKDMRNYCRAFLEEHGNRIFVGGILALGSVVIVTPIAFEIKAWVNQQEYFKKNTPLCDRVMSGFDGNNNGMIDPLEAVKMARAVGYDKTFPTGNLVVSLSPGDYSKRTATLTLSSHGTTANIGGQEVRPVWYECHEFPLSRLEDVGLGLDKN